MHAEKDKKSASAVKNIQGQKEGDRKHGQQAGREKMKRMDI